MIDIGKLKKACGGELVQVGDYSGVFQAYESDTRKDLINSVFFAFAGDNFDGHNYLDLAVEKGAKALVVSCDRDYPAGLHVIKVDDTIEAWQNLASYLLDQQKKLLRFGITGSSGKTSTNAILTCLLNKIFAGAVLSTRGNTNNHIGVAQNIMRLEVDHRCVSLEMGTNHPGEIAVLSKIVGAQGAILTTVGASHIGNFDGLQGILNEKLDIFRFMGLGGVAVLPYHLLSEAKSILNERDDLEFVSFGEEAGADVRLLNYEQDFSGSRFDISCKNGVEWSFETTLTGRHQILNICACIALLKSFDEQLRVDLYQILKSELKELDLPGMRMRQAHVGSLDFVLDCYNANPQSMKAFLAWVEDLYEDGYLVLGDMLELGEKAEFYHREILRMAQKMKGFQLVTVGECFEKVNSAGNSFLTSEQAANFLKSVIKEKSSLFLKASRGIKLEKIYDQFKG